MSQRLEINKLVAAEEDGEMLLLDGLFIHDDRFYGAVGTRFYPIYKDEFDEMANISDEDFEAYLIDGGMDSRSAARLTEECSPYDRALIQFDNSYEELWDYLREFLGVTEEEVPAFNCTGGGRMYSAEFAGTLDPILTEAIRLFETENVSLEKLQECLKTVEKHVYEN